MVYSWHPMATEYWANYSMKSSFNTYLFLLFVGSGTYITVIAIYYYYWEGLAQPMPFNGYIAPMFANFVVTFYVILRYISPLDIFIG